MRAVPLIAALLASSQAMAQVSEVVPETTLVGTGGRLTFSGMRSSTRHDGTAFAVLQLPTVPLTINSGFEIQTAVRALGENNSSEATINAEFVTTEGMILYWTMIGPGTLDLTGPGVDQHITSTIFANKPYDPTDILVPGTYALRLSQSIVSGDWPVPAAPARPTASITAFV